MSVIKFLQIEDVIGIHQLQVDTYGGMHGIRDRGLLESALAVPQFSFGGHSVHDGIADMATAYIFHIIKNHPFLDGNKRTGVTGGLIFLRYNGIFAKWTQSQMYELGIKVANSELTKEEIAQLPFLLSEST